MCEGAWPGVSWTVQTPRSVSISDARHEIVVRLDQLGDPGGDLLDALGVALERLLGDAARPRDLDPAGERGRRVLGGAHGVGVVGMEP